MSTHVKYNTKDHIHLDFTFQSDADPHDYPSSALCLVECSDGRWFVEQEYGTEYSGFEGIPVSSEDVDTVPHFYSDMRSAAHAAFEHIQRIYPTVNRQRFDTLVAAD
jgi:hypothetical protein